MTRYKKHSGFISSLLRYTGYGEQMIAFRRKMYRCYEDVTNRNMNSVAQVHLQVILCGSTAEGLSAPLESDADIMLVLTDTVCKDYSNSITHEEEYQFKLDLTHSRPGYSLLQEIHICNRLPLGAALEDSMTEIAPDGSYLSSDTFRNIVKNRVIDVSHWPGNQMFINVNNETQGPSVQSIKFGVLAEDFVIALKCECLKYIEEWRERRRHYQWPPMAVIREVSSLDSHVVPVGHTTSNVKYLEWRICYTKGEIRLVHSLNDCLTKVLILLKQIAKVTLKPLSKDMSSYLMKNVVFWLAEVNDYNYFTEYALIVALKKALAYLKHFVVTKNFPSYMIPQRNLLEGKLTHSQRIKICMRIDSLLKEGPYMVLKIAKIRTAIATYYSKTPTEISQYSKDWHMIHIIKYILVFLATRQISFSYEQAVKSLFSNRLARSLQVRLSWHLFNINNLTLSYEDIEELYDMFNNPEDIIRRLHDNEYQFQVLPCLS